MEKALKKFAALAVALAVLAALGAVRPCVVGATEAEAPAYAGGIRFQNPSFIGVKSTSTVGSSLNASKAKLLVNGQGLLYAICPGGGSAGDYSRAFDTNVAGTIDVHSRSVDNILGGSYQKTIGPPVFTKLYTTPTGVATDTASRNLQPECWVPPWPVRFENGLLGVQSATGGDTHFLYRLDSNTNP